MKYIIVVDKQTRTNPSTEKREVQIEIDELRKKGNKHDDLIIENSKAKIIRRIGITPYHVTYILDKEEVENIGEVKIPLFEGNNYIYIKDQYNNQMCAEYIIKNDFTDMYVTNLQMSSAIEESADKIHLFVSQKLEGYSDTKTTKAMIELKANQIKQEVSEEYATQEALETEKSERLQTANQIKEEVSNTYATQGQLQQEKSERIQTATQLSGEVSKKLNNSDFTSAKIMLAINNDTSEAKINADKIDIDGKAVHFKTNINETIGPFTEADRQKAINYIMETGTLTTEEFKKYDINGDGEINSGDTLYIARAIANGGYYTFSGTYEINPFSKNKSLAIYDDRGFYRAIISLSYIYLYNLYAGGINVDGNIFVENDGGSMSTFNDDGTFVLYINGVINTSKGEVQLKPSTIYSNISGTAGTVTLYESASNFDYIEIFYGSGAERSVKVSNPNGKDIELQTGLWNNDTTIQNFKRMKINGTTISAVSGFVGSLNTWNNSVSTTDNIKIYKVIGYK